LRLARSARGARAGQVQARRSHPGARRTGQAPVHDDRRRHPRGSGCPTSADATLEPAASIEGTMCMTIHQPPRLAPGILKRLGSTIIEEALVGDLFEAYQTRRSRFWYWQQVGVAIGVGACRDVWHHLPMALGAIVTGLFVAATPVWLLINTSAASLSNVPLPVSIQILSAWLVVF